MKAIRLHTRGGTEQLMYEDAPKPRPGSGDALVHVYAAGITPTELSWSPTYTHSDGTARIPSIPGHDLSGVVEEVASGVTDVTVGEEVYALTDFWRDGTAAEYVAVRATLRRNHTVSITPMLLQSLFPRSPHGRRCLFTPVSPMTDES